MVLLSASRAALGTSSLIFAALGAPQFQPGNFRGQGGNPVTIVTQRFTTPGLQSGAGNTGLSFVPIQQSRGGANGSPQFVSTQSGNPQITSIQTGNPSNQDDEFGQRNPFLRGFNGNPQFINPQSGNPTGQLTTFVQGNPSLLQSDGVVNGNPQFFTPTQDGNPSSQFVQGTQNNPLAITGLIQSGPISTGGILITRPGPKFKVNTITKEIIPNDNQSSNGTQVDNS